MLDWLTYGVQSYDHKITEGEEVLYQNAIDRYFALELERATVGCFCEHQQIQFAPKKTQKLILLLVIKDPTQSTPLKAYKGVDLLLTHFI